MDDSIEEGFDLKRDEEKIIKVIGVGGGGGNAVTHMYRNSEIHDVTFLLCNTDKQALKRSNVPNKLVLGEAITKGLGAGNRPEKAKAAAEASMNEIQNLLKDGTQMVFITAGMGGGTGTGAAPVVAQIAKEMDILTVAIVTIPFRFEGYQKIKQALDGVDAISQNVDALLVVNNEQLRKIYKDWTMKNAFAKADDTLAIAAKSIAEIITVPGLINLDFADVNTTLKDGGVALISIGYGKGDSRVGDAIEDALKSPLLNDKDVFTAKKILFNISCSEEYDLRMEETDYINSFMEPFNNRIEVIWGTTYDPEMGERVKMTILASGFGVEDIPGWEEKQEEIRKRIDDIYGKPDKATSKSEIYILSAEDMDNDEIISLLEDNPAYNRDAKVFKEYKTKSEASTKSAQGSGRGQSGEAISF